MKYKKMALVLALGVGLSACNNQQPVENNTKTEVSEEANNEKVDKKVENSNQNMESVSVYASFFPIYNLTKQIAGDKFDVRSFTNLKTESHGWEPSAKDIAELSNSQVMFINGAGMEEWEESLESSSEIELVNTTVNIDLLEGSHENEENEDHGHEDYDNGHNHGEFDPHTWLSPKNGIAQAKVIAEKLSEIDPANKDYYMDNCKKIEEELNAMIDEYTEKFENLDNKNFLVSHQAFGYLAHDFGLNQIALTSLGATEDADAKTLRDAILKAKNLGINTVFYEMGGSDKSANTIADEIGAKTVPLNTLEFATDEELNNGTSYQDLIKYNLEELYKSMEK
ncbi:metal ABC transporter solute-binding protein, Zn/Mn family [Anaerococcus sp. ENR1011]|uniref:Metal ABC transporter solute-binding protein, Zn/Mn family n=1 Tax=Anaerococcus groningensis TaxID=3115616 RepID=A0ABW9N1F9_9FIRM